MTNITPHNRRELRLSSLAELEGELARIEAAHREGRLQATGNWTPGQILNHLSAWIEFGYEGYPPALHPPPRLVRLMLRLGRGRFMRRPLPTGFRIPGAEGGTFATEVVPFEQGMSRLQRALERLKAGEGPRYPSPAFGRLTHSATVLLTLRHAELHLSFLQY
jgi:hypothetical protein